MRNRNNTRFYNLGLSATSTETIRLQLELSKYLFYFVTEEVDCPGHVSEKLWLPLLGGSIPCTLPKRWTSSSRVPRRIACSVSRITVASTI